MNIRSYVLLPLLLATVFAQAEEAIQYHTYSVCRNQKAVRTIRIEKAKNGFWVAYYTKLGQDKEVARAQNVDSSIKVVENIKENLNKANWKCKDLQNVTTTVAPNSEENRKE